MQDLPKVAQGVNRTVAIITGITAIHTEHCSEKESISHKTVGLQPPSVRVLLPRPAPLSFCRPPTLSHPFLPSCLPCTKRWLLSSRTFPPISSPSPSQLFLMYTLLFKIPCPYFFLLLRGWLTQKDPGQEKHETWRTESGKRK